MVLNGRRLLDRNLSGPRDTPRLRPPVADAVDEGIVQDRQQPGPQRPARPKAVTLLIGAHQRILHQILGIAVVTGKRARIAPQGRELAEDVEAGGSRFHAPYTVPPNGFIPGTGGCVIRPQVPRTQAVSARGVARMNAAPRLF